MYMCTCIIVCTSVWFQGNQSPPPKNKNKQQQAKAQELGSYLQAGFKGLMAKHEIIGDVRGLGMMLGIELVTDRWVWLACVCDPLPPPFGRGRYTKTQPPR